MRSDNPLFYWLFASSQIMTRLKRLFAVTMSQRTFGTVTSLRSPLAISDTSGHQSSDRQDRVFACCTPEVRVFACYELISVSP